MQRFILHWGEMGTRWGVNRTVAQVHALLYISPKPLSAEEIGKILSIARSNVSNSLKELQRWGIIRVVHVLGDRQDHFESLKDVWQMFQTVLDERKRREIDPTVAVLRECVAELEKGGPADAQTRQRLREMLEFFEGATSVYQEVRRLSPDALRKFVKLGGKVQKLLSAVA
jgi:DNA-binding transcriptional regulator GbsR (MarR family)